MTFRVDLLEECLDMEVNCLAKELAMSLGAVRWLD